MPPQRTFHVRCYVDTGWLDSIPWGACLSSICTCFLVGAALDDAAPADTRPNWSGAVRWVCSIWGQCIPVQQDTWFHQGFLRINGWLPGSDRLAHGEMKRLLLPGNWGSIGTGKWGYRDSEAASFQRGAFNLPDVLLVVSTFQFGWLWPALTIFSPAIFVRLSPPRVEQAWCYIRWRSLKSE